MKTAGLMLDFYDDKSGATLRAKCPTPESLPESVKEAHILSPEERDVLRDDAFALILHNEGKQLRKFACVDEGNTVLSTIYFMENFDKLPPEAVKTAAVNLIAFNEEFGLAAPELLKLAAVTGMSRKRDSMQQPTVGDESDWAQRTNLRSIQGGADGSRVIQATGNMKTASEKVAYTLGDTHIVGTLAGGSLGALKGAVRPGKDEQGKTKSRVKGAIKGWGKGAIVGNLAAAGANTAAIGSVRGAASAYGNAIKGAFTKKVANVVDVSGLEPEVYEQNKTASLTALGDRFSLDSYTDVQDAIHYFNEGWTAMSPEDRHEFSVKTAARAEDLGIEVPELMQRYGSTEYSPDIEAHIANRRAIMPEHSEVWDALQEKRASIEPEVFANLLRTADEAVGLNYEWGGAVMDPYYATFGGRSEQEKVAWAWEGTEGEKLTEDDLRAIDLEEVRANFTPDFAEAFSHDPTTIFDSMPADTKQVLARMVKTSAIGDLGSQSARAKWWKMKQVAKQGPKLTIPKPQP